jgi:hypothetical protein
MKYTLTFGITRRETTQRVMAVKLTRLTHKLAIQLHLVAEICTICSSRAKRSVRKLVETPSYCKVERVQFSTEAVSIPQSLTIAVITLTHPPPPPTQTARQVRVTPNTRSLTCEK